MTGGPIRGGGGGRLRKLRRQRRRRRQIAARSHDSSLVRPRRHQSGRPLRGQIAGTRIRAGSARLKKSPWRDSERLAETRRDSDQCLSLNPFLFPPSLWSLVTSLPPPPEAPAPRTSRDALVEKAHLAGLRRQGKGGMGGGYRSGSVSGTKQLMNIRSSGFCTTL